MIYCHWSKQGESTLISRRMKEQKKLIYKQAAGAGNGATLQSALSAALTRFPKAASRVEKLGADGSKVQFINVTRLHRGMLMGAFHKLTHGAAQQVIEMSEENPEWPVALVSANSTDKPNREFIGGSLYFGIWKNHAIVHQSAGCRSVHFQEHLSWFLSKPPPDRDPGAPTRQIVVSLDDPLSPKLREISQKRVKRVILGSTLVTGPVRATTASNKPRTSVKFTPRGGVWEAVKKLLKDVKGEIPDFLLDDNLGQEDIHATLELWCSKRDAESTAGDVLSALGRSLSDSDSPDYTVILADGTKIGKDEVKVEDSFSVECVQHQPTLESLFASMVAYLKRLIDSKDVIEKESFGNL